MTRVRVLGLVAYMLPTPGAFPADAQAPPGITAEKVTTQSGSRGVMMRPAAPGRYAAVLHLHGSGDTVENNLEILRLFARAGFVALDVEYRRTETGRVDAADIDRSLDLLNGSRHVLRGVVGVNGFSLGGRMALRVAASRKVLAVSAIAARTSAGSPTILDQAGDLKCPVLLQHGVDDASVPYEDSVLLERKLKSLRRTVSFFGYPGAGHRDLPWNRVYDRIVAFFRTHLD
jgi:dipeptidyl aminopeptidase/acylaminoacyl peptidase